MFCRAADKVGGMTEKDAWFETETRDRRRVIRIGGRWTLPAVPALERRLGKLTESDLPATLDLAGIEQLDTAGAWLIGRLRQRLLGKGKEVEIEGLPADFLPLYDRVSKAAEQPILPPEPRSSSTTRGCGRSARSSISSDSVCCSGLCCL